MYPPSIRASTLQNAFTLLEVMTVLVIVAILIVVLAPSVSYLRTRSQKVQCISNLRSLHVATAAYVRENHAWPQIVLSQPGDPTYARAWIDALTPYGLTQINWICPAIQQALGAPDLGDFANARMDYYPTPFDTRETSPFQYTRACHALGLG